MKQFFERYKTHLIILLSIIVISFAYVPDVLDGKVLSQSDITQYKGAAKEFNEYGKKGERILWTNSQFSGMPTYQISGVAGENPLQYLRLPKRPLTWEKLFLMLFCGYIMFISFRIKPWLAFIGAIATTFVTGNMTVIEAGHNTQALAIAYLPLIIAGMQYLFRKRYLLGFNLVAVGMALQLVMNHVQITYYTGIIIVIWMIFQLYEHIKSKNLKHYLIVSGLALGGVILALGANSLNLMLTQEYVKDTIRGKSEITITQDGKLSEEPPSDGLARWYAFQWSNGWDDLAAMVIPNYAGGGANTGLYYGALPFTSGPQYMGASVIFLALFAFLLMSSYKRWWLLAAILLAIALSMGKNNFVWLNDFFFNHVPFYNKFRAPTMALTIVQICLPIMAIIGLNKFLNGEQTEEVKKKLKYAGIGMGAFLLILVFFSGIFNDYRTPRTIDPISGQVVDDRDQDLIDRYKLSPEQFEQNVVQERIKLLKNDGYRSLFFFAIIFGILWFYHKGKLKLNVSLILIGAFILIDFWSVDKRYLSSENFKTKRQIDNEVPPTQADLAIMQDQSHYRVLDLLQNPMSNTRASHFHKSIGGYNAAKLRRYQEFFDWYVSKDLQSGNVMNSKYLNMLNMKYVIYSAKQGGEALYTINPGAYGNAWFVPNIKMVANADSAILALANFDPTQTAIVEEKHKDVITSMQFPTDSNATIELVSYHPEEMKYKSKSNVDGFGVFSEVYYDKGWNAYIDNEKVAYAQVDFILRGLNIPKGEHEIVFKFEPETYKKGKTISLASNGIIYLILIVSLALGIRNELKAQ